MNNIPQISSVQFKRGKRLNLERSLRGLNRPLAGEPVFETDTFALKIGDGIHDYIDLPYSQENDLVTQGYYYAGVFWAEPAHSNMLPRRISQLYYDIPTDEIYYYYGKDAAFHKLIGTATADSNKPGLVKLYSAYGNNVDGTIIQSFLTEKLKKKVEISLAEAGEECVIFELNK